MKSKTVVKLLIGITVIGGGMGYVVVQAMQSSWSYYYSVDEFSAAGPAAREHSFRLAGRVKPGSVVRDLEQVTLAFTLAGTTAELPVRYRGVTPDNFTEDREVVVEGRLVATGVFEADTLMTRCESKYQRKVN
ncbi:MAG: cytochrome c maturation protein CcmE [Planctomycetes bacterium]|jgi:cytochrome c-type biogenesis protein CcmE|nr:cytochrome c maturation protein CcmE [Planctomycetota bacterium]